MRQNDPLKHESVNMKCAKHVSFQQTAMLRCPDFPLSHKDFCSSSSHAHGLWWWNKTRDGKLWTICSPRNILIHTCMHREGNINQELIMHYLLRIYCQAIPDHKPVQFQYRLSQWRHGPMERWDSEKTQSRRWWGEDGGGGGGGKGWRSRSIFLNLTCSLFEAWWRKWADVGEWAGEKDGRGGGRRAGENVWHTGGEGSIWVTGECKEEGRERHKEWRI